MTKAKKSAFGMKRYKACDDFIFKALRRHGRLSLADFKTERHELYDARNYRFLTDAQLRAGLKRLKAKGWIKQTRGKYFLILCFVLLDHKSFPLI